MFCQYTQYKITPQAVDFCLVSTNTGKKREQQQTQQISKLL